MINIYTIQFSDPEFLALQHQTFKKFLKDDHQLICINNSSRAPQIKKAIQDKAAELGIPHMVPESVNHSQSGWSHQTALNWTWKNFIMNNNNDTSIIIDHDMFLIREMPAYTNFLPIELQWELNKQYDIIGIMQGRGEHIKYFHPGFMIINKNLPDKQTVDFTGGMIDGHACDSGGNWHHYLAAHPQLRIKALNMVNLSHEHDNLIVLPPEARTNYNEADPLQICDNFMLHFRNGSNWAWTEQNQFDYKKEQLRITLNYYMNL